MRSGMADPPRRAASWNVCAAGSSKKDPARCRQVIPRRRDGIVRVMSPRLAAAIVFGVTACGGRTPLEPAVGDGGAGATDLGAGVDGRQPAPDAEPPGRVCAPFTACGGALTGTWAVEDVCASEQSVPGCANGTAGYMDLQSEGMFTFGKDGSYTSQV